MRTLAALLKSRSGATAIEYGLIALVVSVGMIGGAKLLGGQVQVTYDNVKTAVVGNG